MRYPAIASGLPSYGLPTVLPWISAKLSLQHAVTPQISVCIGSRSGGILAIYRLANCFSSGLIWSQRTLMSSSTIRLWGFWRWARPNQRYARGKSRMVQ